jgi:hypothetical protein
MEAGIDRVGSFFERLAEYDQVVFDATATAGSAVSR